MRKCSKLQFMSSFLYFNLCHMCHFLLQTKPNVIRGIYNQVNVDKETLDTYLPVEVDADVSPHVLWTDGQDLEDRETQKSLLRKKLTTVTEVIYSFSSSCPPRIQPCRKMYKLFDGGTKMYSMYSLFLASVILYISKRLIFFVYSPIFRRVRVSYSAAGPVTEHIAVLDGSVGSWTKNTNSQLAGYSKTKHNYFKNRQG